MNSTFRASRLANSEVISQVLFTSEQPKKNKMAFVGILSQIKLILVYLKDSNAASHFVNSLILFALSRPGILFAHAPQKNVSNRWYASALSVRKSQNGSGFKKFFGDVSLCNLCKRVRKSTKWFCGVS